MSFVKRGKGLIFVLLIISVFILSACSNKDSGSSGIEAADNTVFAEGTFLEGISISGKTAEEAAEVGREYLDDKLSELEISIKFTDDTIVLTGEDFEYKELLDLVLPKLIKGGESGDYKINYVLNLTTSGKQKISAAASNCYISPTDATIEGFDTSTGTFTFVEAVVGRRADTSDIISNVRNLLSQKSGGALQANFIEVTPTVTSEALSGKYTKIGSFTTTSTNTADGDSNMKLALSKVNGTVLNPGEEFSYNETVGERTAANGFLPARGLVGGVSVQMYGGGICQASTTIYGAVIRAGLEITERHNHSVESSYVPTGQDAMVSWGTADFKFLNSSEFPIYISSWMDGKVLHVEIYGVQPDWWDTIEVSSSRTETIAPTSGVTYTVDSSLQTGQFKLKSSGNTGYRSVASRTYYKDGTAVKTEDLKSSYYPPTGKVFIIGAGTDTSKIDTSLSSGTVSGTVTSAEPAEGEVITEPPASSTPSESSAAPSSSTPEPSSSAPEPSSSSTPEVSEEPSTTTESSSEVTE